MSDDNRIISLLLQRDEQALVMIREAYGPLCLQIAFRITGSHEDAEECLSDLLLDVWNSVPPNRPDNLRAYLTALIGRNAIRKYERAHRVKRGGRAFAAALDELDSVIASGESVEKTVEQHELTAALTVWLRGLPPDQRRLFMQRYYLSEPVRSVAEANHMTVSAVKMALLRLRKKLKDYLRKEGLL